MRFTAADSLRQRADFREKRYRKLPNLINVHSWMPVAFDPFLAVDEQIIDLNLGVTFLSQNLLSNTEAYASYGWNRNEGSLFNLGVRYFGLGLRFDLDAAFGGNQLFYSLAQYDPETGNPVYQERPAPDKYYSLGLTATLPLYLQRGYHTRQLSLSAGWNYSNGMVANLHRIEWGEDGWISNMQRIGFRRGLHKLSFGAGFSDQVALAHRDFAPRWGYVVSASYTLNPADTYFSDLISCYGQLYLPGVAPHHSLQLAATYQTSIGGYKFPVGLRAVELPLDAPHPARLHLVGHRGQQLHGPVGRLPAAGVVSRGGHRLGALRQARAAERRRRLRAVPRLRPQGDGLAAHLVRGRRPALRHQPLPAARRGDHDRGAVVLPPFERRDVVYRLAGAPVLIFFA